MALCRECGNDPINGVPDDENGYCGKCHKDDWLELSDFFNPKYKMKYSKVKEDMNKLGISTLGQLIYRIWDSQRWKDSYDIIKELFENGIGIIWNK